MATKQKTLPISGIHNAVARGQNRNSGGKKCFQCGSDSHLARNCTEAKKDKMPPQQMHANPHIHEIPQCADFSLSSSSSSDDDADDEWKSYYDGDIEGYDDGDNDDTKPRVKQRLSHDGAAIQALSTTSQGKSASHKTPIVPSQSMAWMSQSPKGKSVNNVMIRNALHTIESLGKALQDIGDYMLAIQQQLQIQQQMIERQGRLIKILEDGALTNSMAKLSINEEK